MKPSRIRVFDGLRITTEHMNHLQTAFASGIEDLREIAGLGKVQRGLTVTASGGQVTVNPGLAFDPQRNRVVCDEPKSAPVTFETGVDTMYVCLKYEAVEDGKVEGQATLLFDSCAVVVQAGLPEAKDNLVAVAKLSNSADGIKVEPLGNTPAPAGQSAAPGKSSFGVSQGITRLKGSLLEIAPSSTSGALAEEVMPIPFAPLSVTSRSLFTATVTVLNPPAAPGPDGQPTQPADSQFRFECRADGESTLDDTGIAQFSISTSSSADVSEKELARLFLEVPEASGAEALRSAYLALRLQRGSDGHLRIVCTLEWPSVPSDESVKAMQSFKPSLSWQALFAWKALGGSAG